MRYIFSAIGGCGSNYLIKTLSLKYEVGKKPDTIFRPRISKLKIEDRNIHQGSLSERAPGFPEIPDETIDSFLLRYIKFIRSSEKRTVVLNTCAELGLFSKYDITDVIFLIRHPLHAYASWAKPERHGDIIESLGGINSESAIKLYANRWNAVIDELLILRDRNLLGGLIRFEYAQNDINEIPELLWLVNDFDHTKRNYNYLSKTAERFLRNITYDRFLRLYLDWNI